MKFQVEVKNFGKIRDARVNLAPFTVISGTNSSGKSFLSKALYTFFSTINKDYVTIEVKKLFISIYNLSHYGFHITRDPSSKIIEIYHNLEEELANLDRTINSTFGNSTLLEQHANNLNIAGKIELIEDLVQELQEELKNKKSNSDYYERVALALKQIKTLKDAVKSPTRILSRKLDEEFKNNLKENFQVLSLIDLISNDHKEKIIEFKIEGLGEIKIDKENIDFNLNTDAISEFQSLHNVVFVESPIYWKLRKPLMEIQKRTRGNSLFHFKNSQSELSGIPKFFFDLMDLLSLDIKSNDESNNFS
ncbi:AAA family ATPase, partial [Acinetobacter baumannii]|uniref:AAA family ATPase n=1 Tax=Acinetobacter baumannii TaxID=470 RepID=UPI0002C9D1F6